MHASGACDPGSTPGSPTNNMDFLNSLMLVTGNSSLVGHLIVFLVFFLESIVFIGLIVPGSAFLVLVGFLISLGLLDWNVALMIPLAIALGDSVSFYLGEKGKHLFKDDNIIFKPKYLEKSELFFEKHKNKSMVLGRFVGVVRPLLPFIAGLFKISRKKFIILDSISIIIWTAVYFSLGFFFGQAIDLIELWYKRSGLFVLFLAAFLLIVYLTKRFVVSRDGLISTFIKVLYLYIRVFVFESRYYRKIENKFPGFFSYLKNRIATDRFSGLPFTLILLSFLYLAALLAGITEDILDYEAIVGIDFRLAGFLESFRHPVLIKIFLLITAMGKLEFILIFAAAFSLVLWFWKKRFHIVALWTAIIGSLIFNLAGKFLIHRARPENGVYVESLFSFPSGHATLAAAFYGFLTYFLWRNLKSLKAKFNILSASFSLIILIGFSRLYLGVHFLSDVAAGFLLGLLWLIIGISISEFMGINGSKDKK